MYFCHILCFASYILQAYATGIYNSENGFPRIDFVVARGDTLEDMDIHNKVQLTVREVDVEQLQYNLTNRKAFYVAEIEVGSDNQKMSVVIDTGTSDLWLMSSNIVCIDKSWLLDGNQLYKRKRSLQDQILQNEPEIAKLSNKPLVKRYGGQAVYSGVTIKTTETCTLFGSFNTGTSSSYHANKTEENFIILYSDETQAYGVWGYEDISIGGYKIDQLYMGIAEAAAAKQGAIGIGLMEYEFTNYGDKPQYTYLNLPARLKSDGLIARNAYSIYSIDGKGSVLFGAIDGAKIDGVLTSYPVVNLNNYTYDTPARFSIVMSEITLSTADDNLTIASNPRAVRFDTSYSWSYFPPSIYYNILEALGGDLDDFGYIPCKAASVNINFNFGGVVYSVPLESLIIENNGVCYIAIERPSITMNVDEIVLGEHIMSNFYVVYDADSMEVSLGKLKNSTDSDILSIASPVGTKAPGYSLTLFVEFWTEDTALTTTLSYTAYEDITETRGSGSPAIQSSLPTLFTFLTFVISVLAL